MLDDLEADDQLERVVFEVRLSEVSGLQADRGRHRGCDRLEHRARDVDADDLARATVGQQPAAVAGAAASVKYKAILRGLGRPQIPGDVLCLDQPTLVLFGNERARRSRSWSDARSLSTSERLPARRLGECAGTIGAMPEVAFVMSDRPALSAARAGRDAGYELELQAVPSSVHLGGFPEPRPSLVYVLLDPQGYVADEGEQALPADAILRRTIFVCAEPPPSDDDDEHVALAAAGRRGVRPRPAVGRRDASAGDPRPAAQPRVLEVA